MTVRQGQDMGSPPTFYYSSRTKQGAQLIGDYYVGYTDGFGDGYKNGFPKGQNFQEPLGRVKGYDEGSKDGFNIGFMTSLGSKTQGTYSDGYDAGFGDGSKDAFPKGLLFSESYSKERGYESGRQDGFAVGFNIGHAAGGSVTDATPPVITIVSTPTVRTDPLIFQVYDNLGFATYQVTCKDRSDGMRLVVYDPADGFDHPFTSSTVTGTGTASDPYIFTLYRSGGWQTGLTFNVKIRAVDNTGNVSVA